MDGKMRLFGAFFAMWLVVYIGAMIFLDNRDQHGLAIIVQIGMWVLLLWVGSVPAGKDR
jgi:hypothetical protein